MTFLVVFGAVVALVPWNIGIPRLGSSTAVAFGGRYPAIEYAGAALTIWGTRATRR